MNFKQEYTLNLWSILFWIICPISFIMSTINIFLLNSTITVFVVIGFVLSILTLIFSKRFTIPTIITIQPSDKK